MTVTTLRVLCELVSDQVTPRADSDSLYIGLEHVQSARFRRVGGGRERDVESGKFAFRRGDVLYGKLRPYLDKAIVADSDGICTTELLVLRPKTGVSPEFLVGVLHSASFIEHAMSGVTGVQHPRTSWQRISEFELPDFGTPERNQIAALLCSAQNAITLNEAAEAKLYALKRAAMRELLTRGLRGEAQKETEIGPIPESWGLVPFENVRDRLQYGTSNRCSLNKARYPVLRIPNIEPARVNTDDLKYCDMQETEANRYLLREGDLLFIRTNGVVERLGSCAVYLGEPANALFASYLIRAQLKLDKVDPKYAAHFFSSPAGTDMIAGRATPAADGKFNLNTGTIDSLLIPVPPTIEEQLEIVAILDAIDRKIALHKEKRAVLEALFKSLLHKLMTGEVRVSDLNLDALERAAEAA